MSEAKTYQGFIEFIEAQPSDRPTDHSRNWSQCMVGDYVGGGLHDPYNFANNDIIENNPALFYALGRMDPINPCNTYGETLEYLKGQCIL